MLKGKADVDVESAILLPLTLDTIDRHSRGCEVSCLAVGSAHGIETCKVHASEQWSDIRRPGPGMDIRVDPVFAYHDYTVLGSHA